MDIQKLKYEAQNKALHIADVSGSALFNADCMDILPLIPDKSVQLICAASHTGRQLVNGIA